MKPGKKQITDASSWTQFRALAAAVRCEALPFIAIRFSVRQSPRLRVLCHSQLAVRCELTIHSNSVQCGGNRLVCACSVPSQLAVRCELTIHSNSVQCEAIASFARALEANPMGVKGDWIQQFGSLDVVGGHAQSGEEAC